MVRQHAILVNVLGDAGQAGWQSVINSLAIRNDAVFISRSRCRHQWLRDQTIDALRRQELPERSRVGKVIRRCAHGHPERLPKLEQGSGPIVGIPISSQVRAITSAVTAKIAAHAAMASRAG